MGSFLGVGYLRSLRDDHLADTGLNGLEGILQLGYHAALDDSLLHQLMEGGLVDFGDDALVVVLIAQHASLLKAVGQGDVESGPGQCLGGFAGNGVGIGVEQVPLSVVGQGSMTGMTPFAIRSARSEPSVVSTSPTKP